MLGTLSSGLEEDRGKHVLILALQCKSDLFRAIFWGFIVIFVAKILESTQLIVLVKSDKARRVFFVKCFYIFAFDDFNN